MFLQPCLEPPQETHTCICDIYVCVIVVQLQLIVTEAERLGVANDGQRQYSDNQTNSLTLTSWGSRHFLFYFCKWCVSFRFFKSNLICSFAKLDQGFRRQFTGFIRVVHGLVFPIFQPTQQADFLVWVFFDRMLDCVQANGKPLMAVIATITSLELHTANEIILRS